MHEASDAFSKDCCHKALECRGGITIPLLYYVTNVGSGYSGKGRFGYVFWAYPYLLVCIG